MQVSHATKGSLVGATNLVARCRRDLWFRATWYVAPTRLVRYWVMLTRFFYPIPRPLPRSIREGELNLADFVIIC